MLLDMFQMLYTADPLLLFDLTQLFYILLIHLKRQIVTCIKKKKIQISGKIKLLQKQAYIFSPLYITKGATSKVAICQLNATLKEENEK